MLLAVLTSLLLPAFADATYTGPSASVQTVAFASGEPVVVDLPLAMGADAVAMPIRLHGAEADRTILVCDTAQCLQPKAVVVPARGVVETVAPTDAMMPQLAVDDELGRSVRCCARPSSDLVVAVVGAQAPARTEVAANGQVVVRAVAVGSLFDEHPELIAGMRMVLVQDEGTHSDAFYAALRQFVVDGGLVSIPGDVAGRLNAEGTALNTRRGAEERLVVDDAGSFIVSERHAVTATPMAVTGDGLILARPAHQSLRDALADLVHIDSTNRSWFNTSLWDSDSPLVTAIAARLQPPAGARAAGLWALVVGLCAAGAGAVVSRRRRHASSPVQGALTVFVVGAVAGLLVVVVSMATATIRRTEVVVQGPGAAQHRITRVKAAVHDVDGPLPEIAFEGPASSFIIGKHHRRTDAHTVAVAMWPSLESSGGWLEVDSTGVVNHFPHDVTVHTYGRSAVLAAGARVAHDDLSYRPTEDDTVLVALLNRFETNVARFTDAAGVPHFVVGSSR